MVMEMMKVTMKVTMVMTMAIVSMVVLPVASEILYAETAPMDFEAWAADLKPGFMLREKMIGDRTCFCKKPESSSSWAYSPSISWPSPSFDFPPAPSLSSTGVPGSSFEFIYISTGEHQGDGLAQPNMTVGHRTTGCGTECNMEVTFDNNNNGAIYEWASPGWNEGEDYPDGCECELIVHMKASSYGYFTYTFAAGSVIHAQGNCAFDRLEFYRPNVEIPERWCDTTLATRSGADMTDMTTGEDVTFKFKFISDAGDGNLVEKGFKLEISGMFFGR